MDPILQSQCLNTIIPNKVNENASSYNFEKTDEKATEAHIFINIVLFYIARITAEYLTTFSPNR